MNPMDIKVINSVKVWLAALVRFALNTFAGKPKHLAQIELTGINEAKIVLNLLIPIDQLQPEIQQMIKTIKVIRVTDSQSTKA
jgi:hypothetical protein